MTRLFLFLIIYMITMNANAVELIKWTRSPIKLSINQDDERMIIVDKNVSVGVPDYLHDKLRIQSLGGVLYLKSSTPFEETRLMLKDLETNEIILIDLVGKKPAKTKLETVKIVFNEEQQSSDVSDVKFDSKVPVPVQLTRYAAQNFYAPMRAIENVPGIKQIAVSLPKSLTLLVPSLPVSANPLAVFRLNGYEVVAIKLQNLSDQLIKLDPRLLNGNFYSATFQHNHLGAQGQSSDTTMLYIVTKGKAENAFLKEPDNEIGSK